MARAGSTTSSIRRMRVNQRADAEFWNERRRSCANALLNRHWITKEEDPELFYAIRDQYTELRDWFAEYTGFSLILTRMMVKLDKSPVVPKSWMGFPEFRETRDYVLFTFALWYLESKTELDQFVLTDIIEQVSEKLLEIEIEISWINYQHRLSMVRALKKLRQLGVLRHIDGEEMDWAQDHHSKNVLYECSPAARYVLRQFPRELRIYEQLQDMSEQIIYPDTDDGNLRNRRHRVYRRLLLEPAIADREWNADELYYVQTQKSKLIDQMQFMFGMEGTRYREGLFFFYPEVTGECSLFPTASAISDLVLLFAGELRRRLGNGDWYVTEQGTVELTQTDIDGLLFRMKEKYQEYWSKDHRAMSLKDLAYALTTHMENWNFGCWTSNEGNMKRFIISSITSRWSADYAWDEDGGQV